MIRAEWRHTAGSGEAAGRTDSNSGSAPPDARRSTSREPNRKDAAERRPSATRRGPCPDFRPGRPCPKSPRVSSRGSRNGETSRRRRTGRCQRTSSPSRPAPRSPTARRTSAPRASRPYKAPEHRSTAPRAIPSAAPRPRGKSQCPPPPRRQSMRSDTSSSSSCAHPLFCRVSSYSAFEVRSSHESSASRSKPQCQT